MSNLRDEDDIKRLSARFYKIYEQAQQDGDLNKLLFCLASVEALCWVCYKDSNPSDDPIHFMLKAIPHYKERIPEFDQKSGAAPKILGPSNDRPPHSYIDVPLKEFYAQLAKNESKRWMLFCSVFCATCILLNFALAVSYFFR